MMIHPYFALTLGLTLAAAPAPPVHTTFVDPGGVLKEVPISPDFITAQGKVHCADLDSIRIFRIEGIDVPENCGKAGGGNPTFRGAEVDYDLRKPEITSRKNREEFQVLFIAHHTQEVLKAYRRLFPGALPFETQTECRNVEIHLGNMPYLSSPMAYVLPVDQDVSPTLVYHEVGHRAFWLLESAQKIPLGGPNHYVHIGLMEYYTASLSGNHLIGAGFLPPTLFRDLAAPVRYPEGITSLKVTLARLAEAMKPFEAKEPWHRAYMGNLEADANLGKKVDGHRSAMVIAHPLWLLRERLGAESMDRLVAKAILGLPEAMAKRAQYLPPDLLGPAPAKAEWYDLVKALLDADLALHQGSHRKLITQTFGGVGYPVERLKG